MGRGFRAHQDLNEGPIGGDLILTVKDADGSSAPSEVAGEGAHTPPGGDINLPGDRPLPREEEFIVESHDMNDRDQEREG